MLFSPIALVMIVGKNWFVAFFPGKEYPPMNAVQTLPREHSLPMKPTPSPRGILVVDDDDIARSLLVTFFRQQGFMVWLASDVEEAVEIYEDYHDEIAFVVMEVDMPGMDGPPTLLKLKELEPDLVCFFITVDWKSEAATEVMEMGAVGLVTKSFLLKVIAGTVRERLANS
jgi:DNA-binding NtrC family response regulator